jgi:hypothetical protein
MATGSKPTLVVFLGGLGDSSVERLVGGARWAATRDSIERALQSGSFDRAVLVTDIDVVLAKSGVTIDVDTGDFHFGRRLAAAIRKYELDRIVYMGGGSIPLFGATDFALMAETVSGGAALTNNRYSSDVMGWTSTVETLGVVEHAGRDNALAPLFAEKAGLDVQELPRTAQSLFDIDAPTDVAVLKLSGAGGVQLRGYTASAEVDITAMTHPAAVPEP